MTLDEKLAHLQATSMEEARSEGNSIIDSYRDALEKVFQEHKEEMTRQSELRINSENMNARQQLSQATAKAQLELKRQYGKVSQELKERVFEEAGTLIQEYMKTDEYVDFLVACIRKALIFANGEPVTIYINPTDETRKDALEAETGTSLTVSKEDFVGGVRCVIRGRNVLIDNSFKTQLRNEFDNFMFRGGEGIV